MSRIPGAVTGKLVSPPVLLSLEALDGAIRATWSHPGGATGFDGYIKQASSGITKFDTKEAGITSPHDFTGLTNGLPYTIGIVAFDAETESVMSNELTETPAQESNPPTPAPLLFGVAG